MSQIVKGISPRTVFACMQNADNVANEEFAAARKRHTMEISEVLARRARRVKEIAQSIEPDEGVVVHLSPRERATVIAALKYYQMNRMYEPSVRSGWIDKHATGNGTLEAMNNFEISKLCDELNLFEESEAA